MDYEITYVNPSHVNVREKTDLFHGKANANAFAAQARRYPGSIEILRVVKITPKGTRTEVTL